MNRAAAAVLALGATVVLAGCAAEPPELLPAPPVEKQAALSYPQTERIFEETFAQLQEADAARDATKLTSRFAGDALAVRTAQYTVALAVPEALPQVLPDSMQAVYVSATTSFPRILIGVSEVPGENLTPVVGIWVQEDIASPYALRAWSHMIPGSALPAMASDVTGSEQLALDAEVNGVTPQSVIENYAEYLRQGAEGELAAQFAPDSYALQLFASRTSLITAAQNVSGAYVDTIQPDFAGSFALATSEGGFLVFAPLDIASSFSVSNATVSVPPKDAALVEGTLSNKVTHRYRDLVVLYVPGPAVTGLTQVVAADHHLVRVTAD